MYRPEKSGLDQSALATTQQRLAEIAEVISEKQDLGRHTAVMLVDGSTMITKSEERNMKTYQRTCSECDHPFTTVFSRQTACSNDCATKRKRRQEREWKGKRDIDCSKLTIYEATVLSYLCGLAPLGHEVHVKMKVICDALHDLKIWVGDHSRIATLIRKLVDKGAIQYIDRRHVPGGFVVLKRPEEFEITFGKYERKLANTLPIWKLYERSEHA